MRTFITLVLVLFTTFFASATDLTANVATIDITPPLEMKYTLGGYGERMNRPAEGIHDRIFAKALTLKKGDRKYLLITIDILGLPANFKPDLLKRISGMGWSNENVMFLPSHSHGSLEMSAINSKNLLNLPQIGIFQPELLDFLLNRFETLVRDADRNYQPVRIGTKTRELEGLNRNRRKDPDLDREMIVTRIDLKNGNPLAMLVNWTAHPTFIDGMDMQLSAEWPGYLQQELQNRIGNGVAVMYYNGAEGDQSYVLNESAGRYEKIQIYGKRLAEKALEIYNTITPVKVKKFDCNYLNVKLPEQVAHPSFMKTGGAEYGLTEQSVKYVLKMLCPDEVGLNALRLGDLVITSVPGEMTSVLGLKIKRSVKEMGVTNASIGGLSSEWISYILSKDQYVNGEGYESSMSFYGPDLGELIVNEVVKNAKQMIDKK